MFFPQGKSLRLPYQLLSAPLGGQLRRTSPSKNKARGKGPIYGGAFSMTEVTHSPWTILVCSHHFCRLHQKWHQTGFPVVGRFKKRKFLVPAAPSIIPIITKWDQMCAPMGVQRRVSNLVGCPPAAWFSYNGPFPRNLLGGGPLF